MSDDELTRLRAEVERLRNVGTWAGVAMHHDSRSGGHEGSSFIACTHHNCSYVRAALAARTPEGAAGEGVGRRIINRARELCRGGAITLRDGVEWCGGCGFEKHDITPDGGRPMWQVEAEKKRAERLEWIKLGAAQEDVDLLDIFKAPAPSGIDCNSVCRRKLVDFFEARVKASGVTVHSCKASDIEEPWTPEAPTPAAHEGEGRRLSAGEEVEVRVDFDAAWERVSVEEVNRPNRQQPYVRAAGLLGWFPHASEGLRRAWRWPSPAGKGAL